MTRPARYEEVKHMTYEHRERAPIIAALAVLREHMEKVHGASPDDYGNNVLGWHKINWPLCQKLPSFDEASKPCQNPECPKAGKCGGVCNHKF